MADPTTVSGPISGTESTLSFETGKLALQSQGAVVATIGSTIVLATANAASGVREGIDFFPLTVDVEERAYAAGKIPGAFFRREGRPSEQAVLTCRLIDRPLRPSFPDGFRNETQVVITVLGADQENPHDVLAINAASAALMVSGIPFDGPIGAVRIAYSQDGTWLPHPTYSQGDESTFELVVAGRELADGDVAIMMVEAGGSEQANAYYEAGAPKVTEAVIANGLEAAKTWIKESISLQRDLVAKAGSRPTMSFTPVLDYGDDVWNAVEAAGASALAEAITISAKAERNAAIDAATAGVIADLAGTSEAPGEFAGRNKEIKEAMRSLTKKLVRKRVVERGQAHRRPRAPRHPPAVGRGRRPAHGPRLRPVPAGRDAGAHRHDAGHAPHEPDARHDRPRHVEALHAPLQHGALGQRRDRPRRFAEAPRDRPRRAGRAGAAARRAEPGGVRLLHPARVRGAVVQRLHLDGVGVRFVAVADGRRRADQVAPVAGIAMGLIYADGKYTTLTDILGAEDAFGDMDFKVAGTAEFVTALQLDTKIEGIPADVLAAALDQAREARMAILEVMHGAISEPRPEVRETAPKIVSFTIPLDKIGEVIGPKGKVINTIQQETGADINVDDDGVVGTVTIGSPDGLKVDRGPPADRADHQPALGEGRRGLHRQGRQHHEVRRLRQHPPGP